MATTIKPRFAAQLQNMPMAVTAGMCGFCIYHVGVDRHATVLSQDHKLGDAIRFADPHEAYRIMREAQGATAALMAGVFGRAVS